MTINYQTMTDQLGEVLEPDQVNQVLLIVKNNIASSFNEKTKETDEGNFSDGLSITIFWSESEQGWYYDIYARDLPELEERPESFDGGLCTSNLKSALSMATSQAQDALRLINKQD